MAFGIPTFEDIMAMRSAQQTRPSKEAFKRRIKKQGPKQKTSTGSKAEEDPMLQPFKLSPVQRLSPDIAQLASKYGRL